MPARLNATVKASGIQPGDKVLDVGIGTGILVSFILKHHPSEIHGCDLAEKMLECVKHKFPGVLTHLCDISELPLPENSLNIAFINGCFSNIMDKSRSLDNLYRLLRPKGRLVISHPLGREFIVELKKNAPFHLDLLPSEAEARRLLEAHGFEITKFRDEAAFYLVVAKTRKQESDASMTGR